MRIPQLTEEPARAAADTAELISDFHELFKRTRGDGGRVTGEGKKREEKRKRGFLALLSCRPRARARIG